MISLRFAFVVFAVAGGVACGIAGAQTPDPKTEPPPDFQKQIEDALKELDKLEKVNPDQPEKTKRQIEDVRQQMRRQLFQGLGVNRGIGVFGQAIGPARPIGVGPGRLGISLQKPPAILVDQLKLPAGQGLIVADVAPEAAAGKAGIQKHDILLEFDGMPVPSDILAFQKAVLDVKAGSEVDATVIRGGQKETIKGIKIPDARLPGFAPAPNVPLVPLIPPAGIVPRGAFNGFQLQGGAGESVRMRVVDDTFVVDYSSGDLKATVKGTRENGIATPTDIVIRDGETNVASQSLEGVPERYRATIERLVAGVK